MSHNKNRNAFTLVELLVVIAIIGVLAALLLPAVNAARGAARKTECVNNMRNVAQAMLNYESSQGQLPPAVKELGTFDDRNLHVAGMVYSILPQIEKSVLRDEIDELIANAAATGQPVELKNALQGSTSLKILNCPSNPSVSQSGSPIAYVANGARFHTTNNPTAGLWRPNGGLSADLNDPATLSGADSISYAVTLDFISSRDGTSQTALVSENVRYQDSDWRPRSVAAESSLALSKTLAEQTMTWSDQLKGSWNEGYVGAREFGAFNQELTPNPNSINPQIHSTPSSYHSAGFVVGFADSHVSFVTSNVDYHVYAGMLTSDGRGVDVAAQLPPNNKVYQELAVSASDIGN